MSFNLQFSVGLPQVFRRVTHCFLNRDKPLEMLHSVFILVQTLWYPWANNAGQRQACGMHTHEAVLAMWCRRSTLYGTVSVTRCNMCKEWILVWHLWTECWHLHHSPIAVLCGTSTAAPWSLVFVGPLSSREIAFPCAAALHCTWVTTVLHAFSLSTSSYHICIFQIMPGI